MSAVLKACSAFRSSTILFRRSVCLNANVKFVSQFAKSERRLRCSKWSTQTLCNTNIQFRFLSVTAVKFNSTNAPNTSGTNSNTSTSATIDASSTAAVDSTANTSVASNPVDLNTVTNANEIDLRNFIIPEPPSAPQYVEIPEQLLSSADLNFSWFLPPAWIFHSLNYLHQYVPWYGSIVIFTLVARILLFPVMIYSQKRTTDFINISPQFTELQQRIYEAKRSGNHVDLIKQTNKLVSLMERNNITPKKMMWNNLIFPFSTAAVFTSFFIALRTMSNYPIESMKTGGLFWFEDLTTVDSTFGLNLLAGLSVYGIAKMGTELGTQAMTSKWVPKVVQYVMPPLVLLLSWAFSMPSSVLVYMITSNIFSVGQVWLINQEFFREKFNLPRKRAPPTQKQEPFNISKTFESTKEKIREFRENTGGSVDHRKNQKVIFEKAGIGPIQKTYKYDPTRITKKN